MEQEKTLTLALAWKVGRGGNDGRTPTELKQKSHTHCSVLTSQIKSGVGSPNSIA
ncbi:uncharacterized protein G2W53_037762 [Senna tora]|uniref:Uncharacterized protein n=1 Tax=Senna tora TaxID=362788 RepID=A0A834SLI8_9FABA|nr:uncharacterized protein G2W53_037762 [Senna tora]